MTYGETIETRNPRGALFKRWGGVLALAATAGSLAACSQDAGAEAPRPGTTKTETVTSTTTTTTTESLSPEDIRKQQAIQDIIDRFHIPEAVINSGPEETYIVPAEIELGEDGEDPTVKKPDADTAKELFGQIFGGSSSGRGVLADFAGWSIGPGVESNLFANTSGLFSESLSERLQTNLGNGGDSTVADVLMEYGPRQQNGIETGYGLACEVVAAGVAYTSDDISDKRPMAVSIVNFKESQDPNPEKTKDPHAFTGKDGDNAMPVPLDLDRAFVAQLSTAWTKAPDGNLRIIWQANNFFEPTVHPGGSVSEALDINLSAIGMSRLSELQPATD